MWNIIGEKLLARKMQKLHRSAHYRAVKAGGTKAMQLAAKAIKKAVPTRFKLARKGIGWKAGRKRGIATAYSARAGVGVGVKRAKFAAVDRAGTKAGKYGGTKRFTKKGVGIGPANFHWLVLGVKNRVIKKTGVNTGSVDASLPGFASKAVKPVLGQMALANRRAAWASIKKDVASGRAY